MPLLKTTVLITGGAYRIGRAIALDLAGHGFTVVIHANSSLDGAQELADEIIAAGGVAYSIQGDLTKQSDVHGLIDAAQKLAGPIDILVNNASIFERDGIENLDEELWNAHFDVHVKAPSFLTSALAVQKPTRERLIINIIDQRVWRPNPNFYSYTLSKSALWTATQIMAQALAPNIRVNAIGPGPSLKNDRQTDADFDQQVDALLLKRGPSLDEFGATIRYLWSAKSVTGQMIALDGGQHLAWETPDLAAKE